MSDALNCTDYFTQNSDISGIGVRVSFYMQVLLLRMSSHENMTLQKPY